MIFSPRPPFTIPLPGGRVLELGARPLVMGVLNVTPDSFAEREPHVDAGRAVEIGLQLEADGADIIDVGGESTRPGATPVDAGSELARVMPVVRGLAGRVRVPISIDTYKAEVAREALAAGASIVNDISGLQLDPGLAAVVAAGDAALILMHNRGDSRQMYARAVYDDVIGEVIDELRAAMMRAAEGGVPLERVILDPGVGFAKQAVHSYGVLAALPELGAALRRPLLVGPSRKSFMREALDGLPAHERDWGTAAAVTAAVLAGAHIVRVHAVRDMAQVVRVAEEIRRHR